MDPLNLRYHAMTFIPLCCCELWYTHSNSDVGCGHGMMCDGFGIDLMVRMHSGVYDTIQCISTQTHDGGWRVHHATLGDYSEQCTEGC
jgi:hypothetical protein